MQFEIKKDEFVKGLQTVQNAISQKNTLPILANLLLECDKNEVTLTATDLDIGISSKVEANVKIPGAITIPAKKLVDIIKELPDDNINILLKKNNMITIESGKAHFKIIGLPKEEFPQLPEFKNQDAITIPQKLLKKIFSITAFAVSRDETRYVLNGVLFIIKQNKIKLVATDGRRLAVTEEDLPQKTLLDKKAIIPAKTIQELSKMLEDDGEIKIQFSENQMFFDLGKTNVISRLIEGDFPNFEQVIPKERKEKLKIERSGFLAAAKRASLLTNPDSLVVKLDVSKNKMVVSKNAPFIGEVKEELDIQYSGKNLSIGFNPIYLIDVLKNLEDESVDFELEDADKPGVIRKGNTYTYVVLPMQLA